MKNPIPRSGLFATKTLVDLQEWIEQMPAKEKAQAYLVMQLTLNSAHELVEELHVAEAV
jgi:hypothetical protein